MKFFSRRGHSNESKPPEPPPEPPASEPAALAPDGDDDGDPLAALRQARERFIEAFPERLASISLLVDSINALGTDGPVHALRQIVHRMSGLAGTIGFPTVSERASDLEQLVILSRTHNFEYGAWEQAVSQLRQAFASDLEAPAPDWAIPDGDTADALTVMVVEDDADVRAIVVGWLRQAGYRVVTVSAGDEAFDRALAERPALILLDVELPGLDGWSVCRQLKTSSELASTPVIFTTSRGGLGDRLTGLALGADDYLVKPVDSRELMLRVSRLLAARPVASAEPVKATSGEVLSYEALLLAGTEACDAGPATLALMRVPQASMDAATTLLVSEARRRDLIGLYDRSHLVVLMPDLPMPAAVDRVRHAVQSMEAAGISGVHAGMAALDREGARTFEALLADADHALTDARFTGRAVSNRVSRDDAQPPVPDVATTVVIADDDPDVSRILDAQMRAAGYQTVLVFDGAAALEAVTARKPALLLLDLMMPKMTGFDVLSALRESQVRPRVVVLSARGREDDVTRAFGLGADDYLSKPFSPQELVARVTRLLR